MTMSSSLSHMPLESTLRVSSGFVKKIPSKFELFRVLFELIDGKVEVNRIRDVEIEDLLGREKVELEIDAMHEFLANKKVMVTGAGGSIGSELVRQVQKFFPAQILMVERSEFALYQIQMEVCHSCDEECLRSTDCGYQG